uniref:MFS transporter n=1 Tax=Ditylenchus dipsaci TaxID=166011 RepID=A0A915DAV2_9BILA
MSLAFWSFHSVRLQVALILSFSLAVHGLMRGNLSMALISKLQSCKASQLVGAKNMISYSVLAILVCTWAVPFVVYFLPHYLFTSTIRFFMGFAQGFFIPCASLMIAKWFAESEKVLLWLYLQLVTS